MTTETDRELLELAGVKVRRERHGMNKSPEHRVWVGMKQRCTNPNRRDFKWYGGAGVKVCSLWMNSFLSFYNHVGPRPSPQHTIDRIDVLGDYEPGNVRWILQRHQVENTTVVRMITIGGKAQSISAWEREMGLAKGVARRRESSGWSITDAILTPSIKGQKLHANVDRDYSCQPRDWHGRYVADNDNEAATLCPSELGVRAPKPQKMTPQ